MARDSLLCCVDLEPYLVSLQIESRECRLQLLCIARDYECVELRLHLRIILLQLQYVVRLEL